jgi:hypothetical protein
MMSLREIKYFLAIVQEGNITTAAQRLHMAQPPLSRQMKQLEEHLGAKLCNTSLSITIHIFKTKAGDLNNFIRRSPYPFIRPHTTLWYRTITFGRVLWTCYRRRYHFDYGLPPF